MARIREFAAGNSLHTDDKGFAAFETLGRRVGGQYDQAGNDLRDIGKANAAAINAIGRWPFNIIDLEQRQAARSQPASKGTGGITARMGRSPGGSITDEQFAPRRMPDLAALNQMSEGAGALGRMLGGGKSGSGQLSYKDQAQLQKEAMRQYQVEQAALDKWQTNYDKGVSNYNDTLEEASRKAADTAATSSADETMRIRQDLVSSGQANIGDFGIGGVYSDPVPPAQPSNWDSIVNGLSGLFSPSSDSAPAAEAAIPDYNPNW